MWSSMIAKAKTSKAAWRRLTKGDDDDGKAKAPPAGISSSDWPKCPITQEPLEDPVIDHEGNTFEREAITEWVRAHGTSPITRNPLSLDQLRTNRALVAVRDSVAQSEEPRGESRPFQVFVRSASNKSFLITIDPSASVSELKAAMEEKDGTPVGEQRMIYGGKQLKDGDCLSDYNIAPRSVIHMVLRLCGGGTRESSRDGPRRSGVVVP